MEDNSPAPLTKTSLELIREIIEHCTSLIRALSPTTKIWLSKRVSLYVKFDLSIRSIDWTS